MPPIGEELSLVIKLRKYPIVYSKSIISNNLTHNRAAWKALGDDSKMTVEKVTRKYKIPENVLKICNRKQTY